MQILFGIAINSFAIYLLLKVKEQFLILFLSLKFK